MSIKSSFSSEKISLQTEELSKLVCPLCYEYMKPPIMECEKGHGICELCHELLSACPICQSNLTHRRSSHLEQLTALVLFPCKTCKKKFSLDELTNHECTITEEEISVTCIIGQIYGDCSWYGPVKDMIDHCSTVHATNYWTKWENITEWNNCNLSNIGVQNVQLIDLTEAIFILIQKYDSNTNSLQWNISCESEKYTENYTYEIQLISDAELAYRNEIENERNILTCLPNKNEISIPLEKIAVFLNENNCVRYKVNIYKNNDGTHKLSDVKYYHEQNEVKIIDVDTQDSNQFKEETCTRCSYILYLFKRIKNCFNC